MGVKSLQTAGVLEQFPEVVNCCHRNFYQKHLLPPGHDCVMKVFLSYIACADIWERASSISVQFLERDFSNAAVYMIFCSPDCLWKRAQVSCAISSHPGSIANLLSALGQVTAAL